MKHGTDLNLSNYRGVLRMVLSLVTDTVVSHCRVAICQRLPQHLASVLSTGPFDPALLGSLRPELLNPNPLSQPATHWHAGVLPEGPVPNFRNFIRSLVRGNCRAGFQSFDKVDEFTTVHAT